MKIDDVLGCINKTLSKERKVKGIKGCGHFVFQSSYTKKIGQIKTFIVTIHFINKDKQPYRVIHLEHTETCSNDMIESTKEKVALVALQELFFLLRLGDEHHYSTFLTGDFSGWN